jgi:hypothetical protein
MNENEVKQMIARLKGLKKNVTKENAMVSFVGAGILDKNGEFTKPYTNLKDFISEIQA